MLGMKNSAVLEFQIAIRMSKRKSKHTITILIMYVSSLNILGSEKCKMPDPTNTYTLKRLHNDAMKLAAQKNEYH